MSDGLAPAPTTDEALTVALECTALEPGLRSIVLFDAPAEVLRGAAGRWAALLGAVTGQAVAVVTLGSAASEEDLWGTTVLRRSAARGWFEWVPGPLTQATTETEPALRMMLIPDLTRLSLETARACIALMGAEVATLQRNGRDDVWAPRLAWMAGCARRGGGDLAAPARPVRAAAIGPDPAADRPRQRRAGPRLGHPQRPV